MLFDSWAGVLPPSQFRRHVIQPTQAIVAALRAASSRRPGHRLSAPGGPADRRVCRGDGRRWRRPGYLDGSRACVARDAAGRGVAGQSRSAGAGRRRRGAAARDRGDPGRLAGPAVRCSISATASCRRRRPSMSPRWWSRCVRPRVAVVLFNLGGPDRPEAIRPFLLNLFTDPGDPARAVLRPAVPRAPASPRRGWSRRVRTMPRWAAGRRCWS